MTKVPDLAALFGSLEMCDCEHCRSVYSPAAYFIDLLEFLRKSGSKLGREENGRSLPPLDVLIGNSPDSTSHIRGKRPDLAHILLTCENTNTTIPYIDLVNEVLESYIKLEGIWDRSRSANDTGDATSKELASNPQYVIDDAYTKLQGAVFPRILPFDRSLEIVRQYLNHLGSSRYDVLRIFNGDGDKKNQLSSEYLDLTKKEFEILTGKDDVGDPSSFKTSQLYAYEDENLKPRLEFKASFTPDMIMSGRVIAILQDKLNTDGATPSLTTNGRYDEITESAVKAFQSKHGLTEDGVVDNDDWSVLSGIAPNTLDAIVSPVSEFLQRTNLSYMELIELLKTKFVNPHQQELARLGSAGFTYKEILSLVKEHFAPPSITETIRIKLVASKLTLDKFKEIVEKSLHTIVLYSNASDCDLSKTKIQYLEGNPLEDKDLWKIHRFIRIQSKLGWPIPELDNALISLEWTIPELDEAHLEKLAQIKELKSRLDLPIDKLSSIWANIGTHGENSLYKKLFLNRTMIKLGLAKGFQPTSDGAVLVDDTQHIYKDNYLPALLAAFQMNAADFESVRADLGMHAVDPVLNLENVSKFYRYSVLSKTLKLKIKDLIAIKNLSGHDPFQTRIPGAALTFIDIVSQVKLSGFSIAQLNYIYGHPGTFDSGLLPQENQVALLIKNIQDGLQNIANDNILPSESLAESTRNKLATIIEPAIADQTIDIISSTGSTYTAPLDSLPSGTDSRPFKFHSSLVKKISYDPNLKELRFTGLMTLKERDLLMSSSGDSNYVTAVKQLYQKSTQFIEQSRAFISKNLKDFLDPSLGDAQAQLLTSSVGSEGIVDPLAMDQKFTYLLKRLLPYLLDKSSRSLVIQILSEDLGLDKAVTEVLLQSILKSNIITTTSRSTGPEMHAMADFLALAGDGLRATYFETVDFTGTSVASGIESTIGWKAQYADSPTEKSPLSARWQGHLRAPRTDVYTFYLRASGSLHLWIGGQPVEHDKPFPLKEGQLYQIKVEYVKKSADAQSMAEVQWSRPNIPKAVISKSYLYSNESLTSLDLPLRSYFLLHKIALLVNTLKISASDLVYLSAHPKDFAGLDPTDNPADPKKPLALFDLNTLLTGMLGLSNIGPALFNQWLRLARLSMLKQSLTKRDIDLTDVFEFASNASKTPVVKRKMQLEIIKKLMVATSQNSDSINVISEWMSLSDTDIRKVLSADWTNLTEKEINDVIADGSLLLVHFVNLLARLSDLQVLTLLLAAAAPGWDVRELSSLIEGRLIKLTVADFKDERALVHLQQAMKLTRQMGISAEKISLWADDEPDAVQAQDIKNTIKAKYSEETWLEIAKPLSDKMRESQRSRLIAYVLTMPTIRKANVTNANQLFEYFLIDVEMGACMATSRIKQAISSVQLFVQRCLLNLEPDVNPSVIDVKRWEWMKNYRVWEANRKVFLYPENWIEPELRDDKSPFFEELESELLQNDLTNKVAERALSSYLYKLDQVAKLQICGMYLQTDFDEDEIYTKSILHVIGRTTIAEPREYYYRRLIDYKTWTPWEKVELDIHAMEGSGEEIQPTSVHTLPVVWNRRLYLFWLVFTEKAKKPDNALYWEISLAWSRYEEGKWIPKKTSKEKYPSYNHNELSKYKLRAIDSDSGLRLQISHEQKRAEEDSTDVERLFEEWVVAEYLLDYYQSDIKLLPKPYSLSPDSVKPLAAGSKIADSYFMGYEAQSSLALKTLTGKPSVPVDILYSTPHYSFHPLNQRYRWPQKSPFFYQDEKYVYFVRSSDVVEAVVQQVEHPDEATISLAYTESPITTYSVSDIQDEILQPPIPDPVMEQVVVSPWVSAEKQLLSKKLKAMNNQSGMEL